MDRHVLFTNIRRARLNNTGVRFFCSALLLSDVLGESGDREYGIRGFGPEPAWEVFTCDLLSIDYKIVRSEVPAAKRARGQLVTGAMLAFPGGLGLELHAARVDRPICVDRLEDYTQVWECLRERVREFWYAPNFPMLTYRPLPRKRS